jgi:phospholipase C
MVLKRFFFLAPLVTLSIACAAQPDGAEEGAAEDNVRVAAQCPATAGAMPRDTVKDIPAAIPIKHVIIVIQENRSFDHMLGSLALTRKDVDGIPKNFSNLDKQGKPVQFHYRADTCFEADSPHDADATDKTLNGNKMDGFVREAAKGGSDGHYVMTYYTQKELPFYHFLANTYAISDRYFSAMVGPTFPNRDFFYAATSNGITETKSMLGVKSIYDAMDEKNVSWGVYNDTAPRQGAIGWSSSHKGFFKHDEFFKRAKEGTLPAVVFFDPSTAQEEHPPYDVQRGERLAKRVYDAVTQSPNWESTALFYTYDEAGGIADHVPPPAACAPSPGLEKFNRLGVRVPLTLVSPYAKKKFVSHATHSHTSILRFIELLHDIPALTARDANADAMLDMFDFSANPKARWPAAVPAGEGGCTSNPGK